jgi:hypothetical protein
MKFPPGMVISYRLETSLPARYTMAWREYDSARFSGSLGMELRSAGGLTRTGKSGKIRLGGRFSVMDKEPAGDGLLSLTPGCDALKNLYTHEPKALNKDRWSSLGLHSLVRYFKYHEVPYKKAAPYLLTFSRKHFNKNSLNNKTRQLRERVKHLWNDSPSQMPCLILKDLRGQGNRRLCKNLCGRLTGSTSKILYAKTKRPTFTNLASREEQLKDLIVNGSRQAKYYLVNAEPGLGKTTALLRKIAQSNCRVLFLAPRHNLLAEIKEKYIHEGGKEDDLVIYKGIKHCRCGHRGALEELMKRGIPYVPFCLSRCSYGEEGQDSLNQCEYHRQKLDVPRKRVLLMATSVLHNEGVFDRKQFGNHKRSVVVIDEEHFEHKTVTISMTFNNVDDNYELLWRLVHEQKLENLQPLLGLAQELQRFLNASGGTAVSPELRLHGTGEEIRGIDGRKITNAIYKYGSAKEDFSCLFYDLLHLHKYGGVVFATLDRRAVSCLMFYRPLEYPDGKTYYFLDGAANVDLYRRLFPGIEPMIDGETPQQLAMFDGAKVIQYVKKSFSITSLKNSHRTNLKELREVVGAILASPRYRGEKVGIITKQKVQKDLETYINREFGDRKPAPVIRHFGDFTGLDIFKEFQVGIITGMHNLSFGDYARQTEQLFESYRTGEHGWEWVELLSTQNYTYKVKNPVYKDPAVQARFKQFCTGATIQAIGRWRPYRTHGRRFCHIFLLNNYDTGLPVRPVSKAQLFEFLGVRGEDVESSAEKVARAANRIMAARGKVSAGDVCKETGLRGPNVSKQLRTHAIDMEWLKDHRYYYRPE